MFEWLCTIMVIASVMLQPSQQIIRDLELRTRNEHGDLLPATRCAWMGGALVISPSLPLYGCASASVVYDGREYPVTSISDVEERCVRLSVPALAEAHTAQHPEIAAPTSLAGKFLYSPDGIHDKPVARAVCLRTTSSSRAVVVRPFNGELPLGSLLVDGEGRLVSMVTGPLCAMKERDRSVRTAGPDALRRIVAATDPLMPFAEWQQKLANDQSVTAARMLATSSTPAALRLAVEDRNRNDPDWGVNVGDDLCLELISILIPERSWALVDDLLAYAARRSHAIEPQVRFELLSAYSQAARGMGGRERLQEWAESGDDRLGGKASWVRPWANWVLASASAANGDRDDALIRFRRLYKEWPWDPEPLYAVLTLLDLTNCAAYLNQGDGILTSQGNTVTNCSSFNNTGNGINVQTGCTVADCSVKFNTLDGIRCTHECLIRGNNVSYAGNGAGDGAAIVAGQLNRIEANHCSRSDRGIDVNLAGNVIVRNTCAANTVNFTFVADNVYGPILNRIAPASPAVNGSVAASTLGSTDANANYAH